MLTSIIYWVFIITFLEQCGHCLFFFVRIFSLPTKVNVIPIPERNPVSVVICTRNEAANLKHNLLSILQQTYTNNAGKRMYEVVVVNDRSADDSASVLANLQQEYAHLKVITISENEPYKIYGKKNAQSQGVEAAANEWLLFTDADCMPVSDDWIENMVYPLTEGMEIVAGYSGYYPSHGLLNNFIRWETLHTFLLYTTYIMANQPYMAVGRNMACTKHAYLKASEATIWKQLPFGDDDMLVSIAGNSDNTAVVGSLNSFTYSKAKTTWQEWLVQKQRHLSAGKHYKPLIKLLLGEYALTHTLIWLSFFAALVFSNSLNVEYHMSIKIVLLLMGIRCGLYWVVWAATARLIFDKRLILFFPLFDIGWMVYNFVFSPYIFFKNKKNWN